jgi:hypothetical protein
MMPIPPGGGLMTIGVPGAVDEFNIGVPNIEIEHLSWLMAYLKTDLEIMIDRVRNLTVEVV